MDDGEYDVRHAGGLALLELPPAPDAVTMEIPTWSEDDAPWIEPRRYGADGPVWDATDEIYITYKDGERDVVTTGDGDIWNKEHSYQRTGSGAYAALRGLGDRVGELGSRVRTGWTDATTRIQGWPQVRPDRNGDDPGRGPDNGARPGPQDHGARHGRTRGDARRHPESVRLPERPDAGLRTRSHRHCPGCSGHEFARRSWWGVFWRGIFGWLLGYAALVLGGFSLPIGRYFILTSLAFCAAYVFRPLWREFVNAEDRHTRGGRR